MACFVFLKHAFWDLPIYLITNTLVLPFYPPKNQKFWKMKKLTGGIIILYLCTKNCNHMMYRQREFFVILVTFCSFTLPPNDPENQNFEKIKKNAWRYLSCYTYMCTINENHMIYGSWNIRCNRQNFLLTQIIKNLKIWKTL